MWEFTVAEGDALPERYDRTIRVPFAPESLLSGIHETMPEGKWLCYRRSVTLPEKAGNGRLLLHIGAADQETEVYWNGVFAGRHIGGYDPFSFDVTEYLAEENTLTIRVRDHLSRKILPYGKQRHDRGGMWYTPVSGIWQTVWLERVPEEYIRSLTIRTGENWAEITASSVKYGTVTVIAPEGIIKTDLVDGVARIQLPSPRLWSPENPYLYRFTITAGKDEVESYFALRTLSIETVDGIPRLCLNGKPYFFHGLLDQGYWCDGLFTPAAPECYEWDIQTMKALGFNTLRKHIKIEPEQFYYDCDRLGMIVFQDMVNNGAYSFIRDTALPTIGLKRLNDRFLNRGREARETFLRSMERTVEQLGNHPCICYWTIFNEGWGQFESTKAYRRLKELDGSRFVDSASGWFAGGESDVVSEHVYFKPFRFHKTEKPLVLSEFGGYVFAPEGHVFNPGKSYGYRNFKRLEDWRAAVAELYEREIVPVVKEGLCGAIYTQVSDIEDEVNGLVSYDRKVVKPDPAAMRAIAKKLKI
ncbi:MAG: glycoside hydrolase family 2 [Oscillibacter sp.]|nr:glycoside hydrolase family 2 [Oscillibacter sp.]